METVQIECRCKDCIYYEPEMVYDDKEFKELNFGKCYYWDYEEGESPNSVDEDDFCSNGVRKDK